MNSRDANLHLRFGAKLRRLGWPNGAYLMSHGASTYTGSKVNFEKITIFLYGPSKWLRENTVWSLMAEGFHATDWEKVD